MWREYAGVDCGVRIELASDPFKRYSRTAEEIEKARRAALTCQDGEPGSFSASLVPFSKAWKTDVYIIEYGGGSQTPKRIEYIDDRELLFPVTTEVENGNRVSFAIGKLGVCKSTAWSYQKEWRYLLTAMPFSLAETAANEQRILKRCFWFFNDLQDYDKLPEYCDLEISDDAFSSMRVTASPALTEDNWLTLQSLLEKYNPDAELLASKLEL